LRTSLRIVTMTRTLSTGRTKFNPQVKWAHGR
jgi:hypothetical protein